MSSFILQAAGWLAETFLGSLVAKAAENKVHQFLAQSGERDLLNNLQSSLQNARFFVNKIESMRIKDENSKERLKELLLQLKDAAYDADDLLDEFQYRSMQQQIEQQGYEASNKRSSSSSYSFYSNSPPSKKIKTSVLSSATSRLFGDAVDDDVIRMREIQGTLDKIITDIKDVTNFIDRDVDGRKHIESSEGRKTSSIPDETEVFGRDKEISALEELLLKSVDVSENSNHDQNVFVLTMVGIGGVGKTTLAQQLYNDKRVQEHFHLKSWVCVSENFTVERLSKEIIESATTKKCDLMSFDALQVVLKETIASRRFLLVLDDVWNEDKHKWESLYSPLRYGASGSRIVVTTRSTKIAEMVGNTNAIHLDGLDEESSWAFFKKCAFGSQNSGAHPQLEVIAKEIVPKLGGLPLAARSVGGLLNAKLDVKDWKTIMQSETWELTQDDNGVLPVLQLSYQFLPMHLKQCFAFCSLFPKDYKFVERELIEIWMAEGFVSAEGNIRMEDKGSKYFHELLSRSFFQKSKYYGFEPRVYLMHDLIHDLVQCISLGESRKIETGMPQEISNTIRHVSICNDNVMDERRLVEFPNRSKLRSLALFENCLNYKMCYHLNNVIPCDLFETLKSIRVLVLKDCKMKELPNSIGDLLHLRYFDITKNNKIERLPDSLCDLCNMQTMILAGCYGIRSLPLGMSKSVNLRHIRTEYGKPNFFLTGEVRLISEIKQVGKLTSLQELPIFKVSKEIGHKLVELSDLTQLHERVRIMNLENVESKEEASKAKLKGKQFLDELILEWSPINETNMEKNELHISDEVLEGLQPHHSLRCLLIREYKGAKCPCWLDVKALSKLEVVGLENCRRWEDISFIGQLSYLKRLHLKGMPMKKQVSLDLFGPTSTNCNFFSSLEELVLEELPLLEELLNLGHFPCLKILEIRGMPAVKKIEHDIFGFTDMGKCFPRLEILEFSNMLALEEWTWTEGRELFPCLRFFRISDCPKLKRLPPVPPTLSKLLLWRVELTELPTLHEESNGTSRSTTASLGCLRISDCPNLRSLEQGVLSHLSYLHVDNCEELMWIPVERLTSLSRLEVDNCPKLGIMTEDKGMNLHLPHSITSLRLSECGDFLKSSSSSLHNLTSLFFLKMRRIA